MNIIIAGAGKVGFNLAKILSIGHNVTIIDTNAEALQSIQENLDILPIRGDVENHKTYELFSDSKIDLFIAVTNSDNTNLVASVIIDSVLSVERKFIRLQKDIYDETEIKNRFSINNVIFPLQLSSQSVSTLLNYPKANNVKQFRYTDFKLISLRVSKNIQCNLLDIQNYAIVGIERDKKFFVPESNRTEVIENDLVYFFGLHESIENMSENLYTEDISVIQKCVVFGGAELGVSIAASLVDVGRSVKLIEKELDLCQKAEEKLSGRATIIHSKYGIHDVFEEEELDSADIFIAATNNDEYNIIKCLEAKDRGIKKVVAINNEMEYYSLMHTLGIIVIRGPKISAYNRIMEEINSTGVVVQKSFCGAMGIVFLRKIYGTTISANKAIKPVQFSNTKLLLLRDGVLELFTNEKVLLADDLIVAFSATKESSKMKQWIYAL